MQSCTLKMCIRDRSYVVVVNNALKNVRIMDWNMMKQHIRCISMKRIVLDVDVVQGHVTLMRSPSDVYKRQAINIPIHPARQEYGKASMPRCKLNTCLLYTSTLDVNVVGAFNCSKRVYKHMLDQEYGRIINISSTNGINTYYPCLLYTSFHYRLFLFL